MGFCYDSVALFMPLFLRRNENIFSGIDNQLLTKKACPAIKQSRPGKQVMAADYPLSIFEKLTSSSERKNARMRR